MDKSCFLPVSTQQQGKRLPPHFLNSKCREAKKLFFLLLVTIGFAFQKTYMVVGHIAHEVATIVRQPGVSPHWLNLTGMLQWKTSAWLCRGPPPLPLFSHTVEHAKKVNQRQKML